MNTMHSLKTLAGIICLALLSSCASVEKAAPPVALLQIPGTTASGTLEAGRCVYTGKCTKCHSPEPIVEHDATEWKDDILPAMSKKAKLTPAECDALKAYVMAVCHQSPQS